MRRLIALCALALATACSPQQQRCDFTHTQDLNFTGGVTADKITVRSFGVTCQKAIGIYEITDAEGHPIWAWATPLPRAFGDVFTEDPDHMLQFLERWSQPDLSTTQSAPEWSTLTPGQTTLDELTYADIRARDLPMLCHYSGTARQLCVFWEPAAGGAGHLFDRDVEESVE